MNEHDRILRRASVLKLKYIHIYMEDPEQDGSATYWKNISRQEKDSSYVNLKTSETGDFLSINPSKTEMLLERDSCEYSLLKCVQHKMREMNVWHICNLGTWRRTKVTFMLKLLPP
jgi:hypothetical protein